MNPTEHPVPDPAARNTARYDTDPDALAWARTRVQHQLDRLAEFEARATETGRTELAHGLSMARRSTEQLLLGGEGCVVGAFDERRPTMFGTPQAIDTAGTVAGGSATDAPYVEDRAATDADPALLLRVEQDGRNSMSGCMRPTDIPALLRQLADTIAAQLGQAAAVAPRPEPITQYGFRLRDSTLLDFDTKAQRDRRMAEFVAAEWEVTPLTRPMLPAQYGEWTEETTGAGGEQA